MLRLQLHLLGALVAGVVVVAGRGRQTVRQSLVVVREQMVGD